MSDELSEFWEKARIYAVKHHLAHLSQDFASWAVLQRITNPSRSYWLHTLIIDYRRHELGSTRQDKRRGSRKKRTRQDLSRLFYSKGEGRLEITDDEYNWDLGRIIGELENSNLDLSERVCIVLITWLGFKKVEIAVVLGVHPSRVTQILEGAFEQLKKKVKRPVKPSVEEILRSERDMAMKRILELEMENERLKNEA